MDKKAIDTDIKNYKIREGALYKRSKFLKEWRERWIVLTTNYLYTFTNKTCEEMTDLIDLKDLKSYKSYLRKDEQMIPPGFKIRSADDMYYFCAKNCHEKWSWIVSLERLMDYKYVGSSNYNNGDWVKTKGFESQLQFENPPSKKPQVKTETKTQAKGEGKSQEKPKQATQSDKKQETNTEKILKQIQQQRKQIEKKRLEFDLRQSQLAAQLTKIQEQWRKINEAKKSLEKKPDQQEKVTQTSVNSPTKETKEQKTEQKKVQETDPNKLSVSNIRNMFEKKAETPSTLNYSLKKQKQTKKQGEKQQDISSFRTRIINYIFEEYRKEAPFSNVLKYVTDFVVNVAGDQNCGYRSFVITQLKGNKNSKYFVEVLIQLLTNYEKYDQGENFMKFFQVCFFQAPAAFQHEQKLKIHKKLLPFFHNITDEQKLCQVLKNIFYMNQIQKYQKEQLGEKLQKLTKQSKNESTALWASKVYNDL